MHIVSPHRTAACLYRDAEGLIARYSRPDRQLEVCEVSGRGSAAAGLLSCWTMRFSQWVVKPFGPCLPFSRWVADGREHRADEMLT